VGKSYQAAAVFAIVVLLAGALFCSAAEQPDESIIIPPGSAIKAEEVPSLTEEELGAFRWLEQNDCEKAEALRQALENLREKDAEKSRQDQINHALKWIGKEDQEKAIFLKVLSERDPELFEMKLQEVIEVEIQETLKLRNREMIRAMVFGTIGGLGLFLFGMGLMSDGLKKVAGQKLKNILESMTKRPWVAFFVGAGVTALVQSSSATTVMVIGFVNAGLLTLKQAICVIIGTNVGTTATAWLVSISGIGAMKITMYALPAIGLGFLMQIGGRTRRVKNIGQIILGFGILFVGIGFMKDGFSPLEQSAQVRELFVSMGNKPLLAILTGTVVTMLLQSSSAAIAIVQLLAMGGAFGNNWETALSVSIPFVLGSNIGTTITAQLAALGASRNAKRAACAHTIFNVAGSAIAYPFVLYGLFGGLVHAVSPWALNGETVGASIALAHLLFNGANSGIFLPLSGLLAKLALKIVPEKPGERLTRPVVLERHLLETPVIALGQAKREMIRMAKTAKRALERSIEGILQNNRKKLASVMEAEDLVDTFQLEITSYLSELSRRQLSDEVSVELPVLLHTVNDLERIGDHAVNIVEIAERKIDQKLSFSDSALSEAERLRKEVDQMFDRIIEAFENNIEAAKEALISENKLNNMQIEFRRSHVERMTEGICSPQTGLIFIDLVDNIEKIGDHLTNIAQAIIGGLQWKGIELKFSRRSKLDSDKP
jgi:phosphate:Na+ symporter